jgi:hypothetical protein
MDSKLKNCTQYILSFSMRKLIEHDENSQAFIMIIFFVTWQATCFFFFAFSFSFSTKS